MISKRIDRKPENDNYGNLADYVRDARHAHDRVASYIEDALHAGEKVLFSWHAGCLADDYNMAIKEVEATQALNTRSKKEKTYHLVISFRPEDEEKLTEETVKDIEKSFALALGFEDHQRHCGVHKNTDNLHIHVAYNMIHPVTLTRHEPYRDFVIRDKVCRVMEQKYGLMVDNGREKERAPQRSNCRAQAMEAQSGQESFLSYVQRQLQDIRAKTWLEFHAFLGQRGLVYKLHGNGAVFVASQGKAACKASSVGREFSKPAMEKKYGKFQESRQEQQTCQELYEKEPRAAVARRSELWARYKELRDARNKEYTVMQENQEDAYSRIQAFFNKRYSEIRFSPLLTKQDRARLYRELKLRKKESLDKLKGERLAGRKALNERCPATWTQYLQREADKGDETALELLRTQAKKADTKKEQGPLLQSLASVKQAIQILSALDKQWKEAVTWISKRGTVVVRLACGELRDFGDTVQLRPAQPGDQEKLALAAHEFAEVRWGQKQISAKGQEENSTRTPERTALAQSTLIR